MILEFQTIKTDVGRTQKIGKMGIYLLWAHLTLKMDRFSHGDQPTSLYKVLTGVFVKFWSKRMILEFLITKKDGGL